MKDYRGFMNVALRSQKVVAPLPGEAAKNVLSGDCRQANQNGMAAVAASGGNDGGSRILS